MTTALARVLRRHWLLALLVLAGVVLRIVTQLAYRPALLYIDSFRYLDDVGVFHPGGINPVGYEWFLWPLLGLGDLLGIGGLAGVAAVQHLLGIGLGVGIYVLLRRFGVREWLAAPAAAPVLLDAYQLQIEQLIMSDLLFQVLLLVAVYLLCWWGPPTPKVAAVAGGVLALSVMVRSVGLTLVVPAAVFVLLAAGLRPREGWRPRLIATGALVVGFGAAVLVYALYGALVAGKFGVGGSGGGGALFGRAAVVANCDELDLTREERLICPREPHEVREELGIDFYLHLWDVQANVDNLLPEGMDVNAAQKSLTREVVLHQPLDIAGGVARDFLKGFAPTRTQTAGDVPLDRWQFQLEHPLYAPDWYTREWAELHDGSDLHADHELTSFLRGYQLGGGYTPGILLGGALLLATAAVAGLGRARRSGLRAVTLLPAGLATTVLLTASVMEFSWRYQLPGLVLIPLAGALGATALFGRPQTIRIPPGRTPPGRIPHRSTPSEESQMLTSFPDDVDSDALDEYASRYGEHRFAPVVVLIAAYNEEESIGDVLDSIPSRCCDLDVDTLVVVDGAKDRTAEVALRHGARTCVAPTNRGQGAALRLGYRLAQQRGARYVVTTDADGQYDIAELPMLLEPLIADRADFVSGSRRLGSNERPALIRRVGTYVFAWIVSALTRQRITDTSFGFRGMRVEVPNSVTLQQPQYQSSELLVGLLSHGYRVLEQPMRMLPRSAGESKKGSSWKYGYRYAKVVLGTWWRERRNNGAPAPAVETVTERPAAVGE
ncbi:glycosyltransferase family 2 protein [Saccharopolyspora sp. TS4A08]|uniref:Glycosyltransferase family 2 protein n=1 Tax=Saccharopolyspora ipomoeae TaxID=3042027 RepID=A0ABT6PXN3_9PSEU|nr:glycosyltransferase family 2 protein [Saccharopolyspora sp. TS4A08]MDI2032776.1 glycosyltransferase family 2 protein [Saccharopolyspora sp. TS4A08]